MTLPVGRIDVRSASLPIALPDPVIPGTTVYPCPAASTIRALVPFLRHRVVLGMMAQADRLC